MSVQTFQTGMPGNADEADEADQGGQTHKPEQEYQETLKCGGRGVGSSAKKGQGGLVLKAPNVLKVLKALCGKRSRTVCVVH